MDTSTTITKKDTSTGELTTKVISPYIELIMDIVGGGTISHRLFYSELCNKDEDELTKAQQEEVAKSMRNLNINISDINTQTDVSEDGAFGILNSIVANKCKFKVMLYMNEQYKNTSFNINKINDATL